MKFVGHAISIAGPKGTNQDALLAPIEASGAWWAAIADGVGGGRSGDFASSSAIEGVRLAISNVTSMRELFESVLRHLNSLADAERFQPTMATTLSATKLVGNTVWVGHVGDTRVTHYRGTGVMTRTRDQTEVQALVDQGALTRRQAERYPRRNVLLSAMGPLRPFDLFESEFEVAVGDRVLLTSDGFHNLIKRRDIASISSQIKDTEEFMSTIQKMVERSVVSDDASALILEVSE